MIDKVINAKSKSAIENKIDSLIDKGIKKWHTLILPASAPSYRYIYRNVPVRYYYDPETGLDRFDAAYEEL